MITLKDFGTTDYFNLLIADSNSRRDTFVAGAPLTLNGSLTVSAGTFNASGKAVMAGGALMVSGGIFNGATSKVTATGVFLTGGTLMAPAMLTDTGDWSVLGGVFTAGSGTVIFAGTNQHVSGSTTFHNLTKSVTAADTLFFQAGSTQTVNGKLTLKGATGKVLALRSSIPGSRWNLDLLGSIAASLLDVQDSDATGKTITTTLSRNSGDNANWIFR
jgi:hypothetical protein